MGEWLVRSQGQYFPQEFLREGRVTQAPIGIGEIEMGNRVLWVERDRFLEGFHRNFCSADLFLKNSEVVPQNGDVSFGGRFRKQ